MGNKLISIIVPIYKVEKYLHRCIDSICKQTYSNLEIILVDDGSPDNCGKICDEYAKKDERIKVIHKQNGGLSDARNYGLKIANGEYIGFVDSDDYIKEDMFETLYKLSEENKADISIVSFYEMIEDHLISVRKSGELQIMDKIEAIKEILIDTKIQSYAWNKLFKRELFNDIQFPVGKNFEDIATTLILFEKCNKVVRLEEPKYYYVRRNESIIGIRNVKTYNDYMDVILEKYLYLKDKYPEIEIYNAYNFIINMIWVYTIIVSYDIKELYTKFNQQYETFKEIIEYYGEELISKLENYNKSVLYMMLTDKETSKPAIKAFYIEFKKKREEGNFSLQI